MTQTSDHATELRLRLIEALIHIHEGNIASLEDGGVAGTFSNDKYEPGDFIYDTAIFLGIKPPSSLTDRGWNPLA